MGGPYKCELYSNVFFLYSLSIYHFTLSSPDTLLLFLDYKPKSGDSLDTSTDNFTAFTGHTVILEYFNIKE